MNKYGTTYSHQIAMESFQTIMMDLEPQYRMGYVDRAMEAIATPDAGMVLDRIYQSAMVRANINFGKVPESQGDLTKFTRYRTIAENLNLLLRQMGEYGIYEIELTKKLHDTIIKCRDDFAYGYKVDSMFLKTTYQSLVYQLCEMIDLCDCIYIDALKAGAESKPFKPESYKELLLVQNVAKFVKMYETGEWAQTMNGIKKDARNLMITIDSNGNESMSHLLQFIFGTSGVTAVGSHVLQRAKGFAAYRNNYDAKTATDFAKDIAAGKTAPDVLKDAAKRAKDINITGGDIKNAAWTSQKLPAKIGIVLTSIVAALLIFRLCVFLYYKAKYSINDMLDDAENILKEHMDRNDVAGISAGRERQKWLYDRLAARHTKMMKGIMENEANARKNLKESNSVDFRPQTSAGGQASGDIEIS